MATSFFWKVWLRLNLLIKNVDKSYTAEVSTVGSTKRNEDIAKKIIEEGSEIKYDTLLSILNQRDRIVCNMVQEGNSILTGCGQYTPRVKGPWLGEDARFDPNVHRITIDMIPSKEMRHALKDLQVEVLGVKESSASIAMVTDTSTGLTDGTVSPGDDIRIEGSKIKLAPEGEAGIGIFFINESGIATPVSRRLTQNDPKTLVARVPLLPTGKYTLQIHTRYANNGGLLKEARILEHSKKLIVS